MHAELIRLRSKLVRNKVALTEKERVILTDLIGEKLGFEAPDIVSEKKTRSRAAPARRRGKPRQKKGDPYSEVYEKSPNQGGTITPEFIVIHDSYGSHDGTRSWILSKESKVSYHYLIGSEGNRTQFVYDKKRAWHAGKSEWDGRSGLNSCSVGIAFWGNTYERTPSDQEIDSCAHKCLYLMKKFKLGIDSVVTHQMISPGRKNDTAPRSYQRVLARIKEIQ